MNTHHLLPATRVEISASAILHNLSLFKNFVGHNNILAPILKSNAYGHGMLQVAQICQRSPHVDYLCVSGIQDALDLRATGITKPLLVLYLDTLSPRLLQDAIAHDIDLMMYDITLLKVLNDLAQKTGKQANLHLKVDTGLNRFGIFPHEVMPFVQKLKSLPLLNLRGIATHGSGATAEHPTLMLAHLQKFDAVLDELAFNNTLPPLRHALSTAGILRFDHDRQTMFRIGDGVYGIWQSDKERVLAQYPHFNLQPALVWKTIIASIKTVPAYSFVGYDRTYQTQHPMKIALLPIGYYEGYNRRNTLDPRANPSYVAIRGHSAPTVGTFCMNTIAVDVSAIPGVSIGDEVTLIGHHAPIDAQSVANALGTGNPTKILANIAPHVPRIVVE